MDDQSFMLKMTESVTKINTQLEALVESNKRQDELFDEHRSNVRKALSEHKNAVEISLTKIEENIEAVKSDQSKIKEFVNRAVGAILVLTFLIPVAVSLVEISPILRGQELSEIGTT